jgi:hypothetical protein
VVHLPEVNRLEVFLRALLLRVVTLLQGQALR